MPYLSPDYQVDVFVSYSHGDPAGTGKSPLKGWTHELLKRLEQDILALETEFDDIVLWRDEFFDPTMHLTDELRQKVSSSSILMVIVSKRYLKSKWCKDEREWFRDQVLARTQDKGRVFVVKVQHTDVEDWPDFLRDERGHAMLGFQFFDPKTGYPIGWPDLLDNNEVFRKELNRMSTVLIGRLRDIRRIIERRSTAESPKKILPKPNKLRVYVHAPPDYSSPIEAILSELQKKDIAAVKPPIQTARTLADLASESKTRMLAAKYCDAMLLLRGDNDERFMSEIFEIGIEECERIQVDRGTDIRCAIFDGTSKDLPIDVSQFNIKRFDLTKNTWSDDFQQWLSGDDATHGDAP